MEKITFCIPSKNNLRYLRDSIRSIRQNSAIEHDVIVYVDADNDGTVDWLVKNKVRYLVNPNTIPMGIAYGYNRCIEAATTAVVCVFHADMVFGKGCDVNLLKHLKPKTVVAATRIEPPLHPAGREKLIQNFGMYPEDFNESAFNSFVQNLVIKNTGVISRGVFAPWIAYKKDLLDIGLMDERLASYFEDSDVFQRLILNGNTMVQSWEAFVYHYTCRGGQFQDGVEKVTSDAAFHKMKEVSQRYFIRKWGSWISNNEYQHPIMHKKYNVGFAVTDVISEDFLHIVEPWASHVYVDNWPCAERYIKYSKTLSGADLTNRVYNHGYIDTLGDDALLSFSQKDFFSDTNENIKVLVNLSDMLSEVDNNSELEYGIFKLKTGVLKDVSSILIKV